MIADVQTSTWYLDDADHADVDDPNPKGLMCPNMHWLYGTKRSAHEKVSAPPWHLQVLYSKDDQTASLNGDAKHPFLPWHLQVLYSKDDQTVSSNGDAKCPVLPWWLQVLQSKGEQASKSNVRNSETVEDVQVATDRSHQKDCRLEPEDYVERSDFNAHSTSPPATSDERMQRSAEYWHSLESLALKKKKKIHDDHRRKPLNPDQHHRYHQHPYHQKPVKKYKQSQMYIKTNE